MDLENLNKKRLLEIPFRYPEYFLSLDIESRFLIARAAVLNGDLDTLTKIVELDVTVVSHVSKCTLFSLAAERVKINLFEFFMDIIPEFAVMEPLENLSPLADAIRHERMKNLKALNDLNLDLTQEIIVKENAFTPVQLAFRWRCRIVFLYFLEKFGKQYVLDQLLKLYGTKNEIMSAAMKPSPYLDLVEILQRHLGFDLNDEYSCNGKKGSIMVLLPDQPKYQDYFSTYQDYFKRRFGLQN